MAWITITTDQTAVSGVQYFCNGASTLQISLPLTPITGSEFSVYDLSGQGWKVVQRDGERCRLFSSLSSLGASGSVFSGDTKQSMVGILATFTFCSDSGYWEVTDYKGNVSLA